jgi:hypothetical protein
MSQERTLEEILRDAVTVVERAGVPDDLRGVAFERVLSEMRVRGRDPSVERRADPEATTLHGRIGARLGVSAEEASEVYFDEEGTLGIAVPASRLDRSKAGGTKQLALLLAAGRQAAGLEEWTSAADIRRVCDEFGRFDSRNFAAVLMEMDDVLQFRGNRQRREARVRRTGFEQAGSLVRSLASATGDHKT